MVIKDKKKNKFSMNIFWQSFVWVFAGFINSSQYFFIVMFNYSNFYSLNFLFITYLNNTKFFRVHIWLNLLIHPKKKKEIWLHLLDSYYSFNWPKRIIFNKYFLSRKLFIKYPRDIYLYYKIYSSLNFYYLYFIIKKNINY